MLVFKFISQAGLQTRQGVRSLSVLPTVRRTGSIHRTSPFRSRFLSNTSKSEGKPQPGGSGGFMIGVGWTLLAIIGIDQALQYKQEQESKEHYRMLYEMQKEADDASQVSWDASLPTKFKCRVMHEESSLDGTKMIRSVRVGDLVEIIEAGVGPNEAYHLCRKPSSDESGSIGWYPIKYLQRVEK